MPIRRKQLPNLIPSKSAQYDSDSKKSSYYKVAENL